MDRKVFGCVIFEDDIGVGKNVSALSFWNQDIANFCLDQTATTHLDSFDRNVQDLKLRNAFMAYPRWKKALCYLILDRKHFWASLKLAFKRKL